MKKHKLLKIWWLFLLFAFFSACTHSNIKKEPIAKIEKSGRKESCRSQEEDKSMMAKINIFKTFTDVFKSSDPGTVCEDNSQSLNEEIDMSNSVSGQENLDKALEFCEISQELWREDKIEEALEMLDQAYDQIMEVDETLNPELIQQKDDLRILISKRILEIYSSRHTSVKGQFDAIPIIINSHVKKEISRFQGPERSFFTNSYRRSGLYRGMIVKSLKEAGLPEELSWLPLIESGYKVNALSRARALGMWQFIPSTGYKFGLYRDNWKDERMDPEKSTAAAIAYLKELHYMFGDWMTVLAGYNCGEGRVLKVIRSQKVNYLDNFWDLYQRLPRETARYVPRFLATLAIVKEPQKYGFDFDEPYKPLEFEVVNIDKQARLKDIATTAGLDFQELKLLNPELRFKATPPRPYSLKVASGSGHVLLSKINDVPSWTAPKRTYRSVYKVHRVRSGETLSKIARRYGTSVRAIKKANRIKRSNKIVVGQRLKIPSSRRYQVSSNTSYKTSYKKKSSVKKYKVRRGDSLWSLAKRYRTTTKKIMRLNNLKKKSLYKGQVLLIPKG